MQRMKLNDDPGTPAGLEANSPAFIVIGAVGGAPHQGVVDVLAEAGMSPQDADAAVSLSRGVLTATDHARATPTQMPVLPPSAAEAVGTPSQWLDQVPAAHVLMLFTRPESAVARAMAEGQAPSQPLAQWCQEVEDVLRLFRHNRRRVTVLDADAATVAPEACLRYLEARLQVRLGRPSPAHARNLPETDAVHQALAALAVQQSEPVQNLYAELEASALPVDPAADLSGPDIDRAFSVYTNGRDQAESLRRELEQQREYAAHELSKTQEAQRQSDAKAEAANEELRRTEARLREYEAQAGQLAEQKQENQLLLTQVHQIQEELESYYLKAKEAEEERRQLKAELENRAQRLQELEQARQEADTQLARANQALESAKADAQEKQDQLARLQEDQKQLQDRLAKAEADLAGKEELQQENELLLLQLHQVQEELESYYLEGQKNAKTLQELKDKLAARDQTIKNKNWAIDKKEEKYQAMLAKKKQLERDLQAARTRLERVKRSASWKVTKPIRAVRRPFVAKSEKSQNV